MDVINLIINGVFSQTVNYNTALFYLINNGLQSNILNVFMPFITNFGSTIACFIICGLIYLFGGIRAKKVAILALLALFISSAAVYFIKHIIVEPRPFLALSNVHQLVSESEIYCSFPSGHTTSSFAAATVIGLKYSIEILNRKLRLIYPLLAFAAVIGFSRVYVGVHYPLDVILGGLIGIISALVVLKYENNIFSNETLEKMGLRKLITLDISKIIKK